MIDLVASELKVDIYDQHPINIPLVRRAFWSISNTPAFSPRNTLDPNKLGVYTTPGGSLSAVNELPGALISQLGFRMLPLCR